MAKGLKKFGLPIPVLVIFSLVACQQNSLVATQETVENRSQKLSTPTIDRLSITEIPLAIPSPTLQATVESSVAEKPSASLPPVLKESKGKIQQWRRLDTTGGGEQTAIAVHPVNPNIVYMASDNGGLFKTENGGDGWFSVSSNLGAYRLGFVALDPLDPDVIYVTAAINYGWGTGGGDKGEIHRSLNGGLSWEFVSGVMGFQNSVPSQAAIVIPYDPSDPGRFDRDGDDLSDILIVGAWTGPADPPVGGIWLSEDEGRIFTQVALKDRNVTAVRAFDGDAKVLFAITHEGEVYRSEDLGQQWLDITGNLPLTHLADLAVHPTNQDILYVTCRWCQTSEAPIWKTIDGGEHWEAVGTEQDQEEIRAAPKILIDRFDPDTLYVTAPKGDQDKGGVYKSTDGGQSWQAMPARLILPDGRPYYWYRFSGGLTIGQTIDGRLFAGGGGGWRYPDSNLTDGREEWEPATIGIGNVQVNTIEVDPLDDTVLYQGISDFGPYKSTDGGLRFYRILGTGWPVTVDNYVWNGPYYNNYNNCVLNCSSICQANGRIGSGGTTDIVISKQNSNIIYSIFRGGSGTGSKVGGVNKSTDGGATWNPLGFQLEAGFELNPETCVPYGFRYLAIDSTNDDIVFAAMEIPSTKTGRLYLTTDGGATWIEIYATSSYISGVEVSTVDPNIVVFTTQTQAYKSEQGGKPDSWQAITPSEISRIQTVKLSPHQVQAYVIGTHNQGIYYTADSGKSWTNNNLIDFFEQTLYENSDQTLEANISTAINPEAYVLKKITAIVFDPIDPDTFYVAGTQNTRASFGVAKVTNAGHDWQRLGLEGLTHRNIFDLAIDQSGTFLYAGTFDGTFQLRLRE